jgi:hypothetical protein
VSLRRYLDIGGDEKFLGEHSVLWGRKKENEEQKKKKEEKKSDFYYLTWMILNFQGILRTELKIDTSRRMASGTC